MLRLVWKSQSFSRVGLLRAILQPCPNPTHSQLSPYWPFAASNSWWAQGWADRWHSRVKGSFCVCAIPPFPHVPLSLLTVDVDAMEQVSQWVCKFPWSTDWWGKEEQSVTSSRLNTLTHHNQSSSDIYKSVDPTSYSPGLLDLAHWYSVMIYHPCWSFSSEDRSPFCGV